MRHIIYVESPFSEGKEITFQIVGEILNVYNENAAVVYKHMLRQNEKIGFCILKDDLVILHHEPEEEGENSKKLNRAVVVKMYNQKASLPKVIFRSSEIKEFSYDEDLKIVFEKYGKTFSVESDYRVKEVVNK